MKNQFSHFDTVIRNIFLSLLFLGYSGICPAEVQQSDSAKYNKNLIVSGYTQFGKVLATNPFLKPTDPVFDQDYDFVALSFQLLKQTNGKNLWEKNYGFPSYGFGVYAASFANTSKFGTPIAVYAIIKAPIRRWNRFSLNYEGGFGLTFNWEGYNPAEGSYNISMGANESVFIDLGMNFSYALSSHFDVGIGYSFTHFSNGAMKSPNYGLNTFAPKISLNYNIDRFIPPVPKERLPVYHRNTSIDFSFFSGVKNVSFSGNNVDSLTKYKGVYYAVYGLNTVLNHQITYKSKIGIGLSLSYDGSYNSTILVEDSKLESIDGSYGDKLSLSIFPSYELVINRLSVVVQPGFYLFRKPSDNNTPVTYQRLGLHYLINERFIAGVCLRAYDYHVSDYIEWTMGYRLSLPTK